MISYAPKITDIGQSLLIRGISGERLMFTSFKIGAGYTTDSEKAMTALVDERMSVGISLIEASEGFVRLEGGFENSNIEGAFEWRELGVFCCGEKEKTITVKTSGSFTYIISESPKVVYDCTVDGKHVEYTYDSLTHYLKLSKAPAVGSEIVITYADPVERLYAYCCDVSGEMLRGDTSDVVVEQTISVLVAVGEAENVTAMISGDTLYARKADFDAHVNNHSNPHNVTKEQLGLGNVLNVAPPSMVPGYELPDNLTTPETKDTLKKIVGKLYRAVEAIRNHIIGYNPHHITPELLGIQYGESGSVNINAGSFRDFTFPFARGYSNIPTVVTGLRGTIPASAAGGICVSVIRTDYTDCTIRVSSVSAVSGVSVTWMAMGTYQA